MTTYRRVEADGTRVYESWNSYKPKPVEDRLIGINRPDDLRAVRFHTRWFLPLDVLPNYQRVMPETRGDDEAYDHMSKPGLCRCHVCKRPGAERYRRRWRKDQGLQS